MAPRTLYFLLVTLLYSGMLDLATCEITPSSTYVTPVAIEIRAGDRQRDLTVRYHASIKPRVKWAVNGDTISDQDTGFAVTNTYSEGNERGVAAVTMPTGHFWRDPQVNISAHFWIEDFRVFLQLKSGNVLNSPHLVHVMHPLYYDVPSGSVLQFVKGEHLQFQLSLRSEDLSQYHIVRSGASIASFDYGFTPPERIIWSSWTDTEIESSTFFRNHIKPFRISEDFEGNSTAKYRSCTVNTTVDYVAGRLNFYLGMRGEAGNPLVSQMYIERNIYIQEEGRAAPYRDNSIVILSSDFLRGDSDARVTPYLPSFDYYAVGYPKPEVSVLRDCGEAGSTISVTDVSDSRFETTVAVRFSNITDTRTETLTIVARSGTFEIRDFVSVRLSRY